MISILIIVIIFAVSVWYLGTPLISKVSSTRRDENARHRLEDLKLRREEIVSALEDLEMDHELKKISDEDYNSVSQETIGEKKEILKKMELMKKGPEPRFCAYCGKSLVSGASFCPHCGKKIKG